jgi:uncharacterized membrane protein YebE (DUF533 family)
MELPGYWLLQTIRRKKRKPMDAIQKEKAKKVAKEVIKVGIAIGVGVAAYKIYENYKDSHDCGSLGYSPSNSPSDAEIDAISAKYM